jgi:hypothetical protein
MGNGWGHSETNPGRKPWHRRVSWTWNREKAPPPIAPNVAYDYNRRPLWGHYSNSFNVFGPYERPILDATGGGDLFARQLPPLHPNMVLQQAFTPVPITGDGSELQGSFGVLPLVNVSQPGQSVVSISTVNGQTNITLGNTTGGQ